MGGTSHWQRIWVLLTISSYLHAERKALFPLEAKKESILTHSTSSTLCLGQCRSSYLTRST